MKILEPASQIKIAYIGIKGLPSKGGAERVVEAITSKLSNIHDITVYCLKSYTPPDTTAHSLNIVRIFGLPGKGLRMLSFDLFSAFHALFVGDYDLVHLHNVEASFILPILKLKFKVISTAHGLFTLGNKWGALATKLLNVLERPFCTVSNQVTSVSLADAEKLKEKYRTDVLYIPNGVENNIEIDWPGTAVKLSTLGLKNNGYIAFMAERIIPLKGLHTLLEAFRILTTDCQLAVIGNLGLDRTYAKKIGQLVDHRVHFVDVINEKSLLFGLIKSSRLFVLPSLNEGMSLALLEAASLGVPIICSDIPANREVLNSEHAIFFRSGDVSDLTEKLTWAFEYPDETKQMGISAQAWVREKFSWGVIAGQYDQLYRKMGKIGKRNVRIVKSEL